MPETFEFGPEMFGHESFHTSNRVGKSVPSAARIAGQRPSWSILAFKLFTCGTTNQVDIFLVMTYTLAEPALSYRAIE